MSVALESYQPVLDPALNVLTELSENKEAELLVPNHPIAVGLAVDIQNLISRLFPYLNLDIAIQGVRRSYQISGKILPLDEIKERIEGKKEEGIDNLLLKMRITQGDFELSDRELTSGTILCTQNSSSGIYVSGRSNNFVPLSVLSRYMEENGVPLPPKKGKIALSLSYMHVPFYISTLYQDFEPPLTFTDKSGKLCPLYPVSSKEQHSLPSPVWQLIYHPIHWDSWGVYYQAALLILSGERTIEEFAERPRDLIHIRKHIDKATPTVYEILEASIEKRRLGDILRKYGAQNEYYIGFSLRSLLKALNYLANPDSLTGTRKRHLDHLVENYNNQYASRYGKREITSEELVEAVGLGKSGQQKQHPTNI